jgi:hypothetical protein
LKLSSQVRAAASAASRLVFTGVAAGAWLCRRLPGTKLAAIWIAQIDLAPWRGNEKSPALRADQERK